MLKYILGNAAKIGIIRCLGTLSSFLLIVVVTHNLAIEDVGSFFIALSVVAALVIVIKLGLDQAVLRFHADSLYSKKNNNTLVGKVLKLFVFINIITFCFYYVLSDYLYLSILNSPRLSDSSNYIFFWGGFSALLFIYGGYMRANSYFTVAAMSNTPLAALITLLLLLLYTYGFRLNLSIDILIQIFLYAQIIALVSLLLIKHYFYRPQDIFLDTEHTRYSELLSFATPIFLNHILLYILAHADILILSKYYDNHIVAMYGVSAKLLVFISFFISIISGVLPPIISKLKIAGDLSGLESTVRKLTTLIGIPSLCVLLGIVVFSETILSIYGSQYTQASQILIILSLSQTVNVLVGSCGYILVNFGYGKMTMLSSFIWALIAITSSVFVAKEGGDVKYIAIIFSSCVACNQIHMWYLCRKYCAINTLFSFKVLINVINIRKVHF